MKLPPASVRPFPIYFYNSWRRARCFIATSIRRRARHSDRPIPYRAKIRLNNSRPSDIRGFRRPLSAPLVNARESRQGPLPVNGRKRREEKSSEIQPRSMRFIFQLDCTSPSSPSPHFATMVHEVMKWQHGVSRGRERG